MRLLPIVVAAVLATVLLSADRTSAFTIDPGSGTNSDGSPRYVDPDDQIQFMLGLRGDGQNLGPDRSSGRNLHAQELITNQGVLSPDWFFSTARPRR